MATDTLRLQNALYIEYRLFENVIYVETNVERDSMLLGRQWFIAVFTKGKARI